MRPRNLFLVLGLVGTTLAVPAGGKELCGQLLADTTWQAADSPYHVICDVVLFPGYTLTIEPSVTILFDPGTRLTVRGSLEALGTEDERITLTSADPPAVWHGVDLATNQGGTGVLTHVDISYASAAVAVECCWGAENPGFISHSIFRNNVTALAGYAGYPLEVENSLFEDNQTAVAAADKVIRGSTFRNNLRGLNQTERISVFSSVFEGHEIALWGGRGEVRDCDVRDNSVGVQAFFEGFDLFANRITRNDVGVILNDYNGQTGTVELNEIYDNTTFNLKNGSDMNKHVPNNGWGTMDAGVIAAGIYDGYDDPSLGLVLFEPVLVRDDILFEDGLESGTTSSWSATEGESPPPEEQEFCGGIYADTTWRADQSPVRVTCDVVLFPGYTLTVEPGVTIYFDPGTQLIVRGALDAFGTPEDRIVLTASDSAQKWHGIHFSTNQGARGVLENADFSYATTALGVECCWGNEQPLTVSDSTFRRNGVALGGYAGYDVQVSSCLFEYNDTAITAADKVIRDSVFRENTYGLAQTERIDVFSSVFEGHDIALWGGRGEVRDCEIYGNLVGVQAFFEGFDLFGNRIFDNDIGAILGDYSGSTVDLEWNDFFGNTSFHVKNGSSVAQGIPNNWWGTTDPQAIELKIHDGRDDPSLGLVEVDPILNVPHNPSP